MVAMTVDQNPELASIVGGASRTSGEARCSAETISKVTGVTVGARTTTSAQGFRGYRRRRDRKPKSKQVRQFQITKQTA